MANRTPTIGQAGSPRLRAIAAFGSSALLGLTVPTALEFAANHKRYFWRLGDDAEWLIAVTGSTFLSWIAVGGFAYYVLSTRPPRFGMGHIGAVLGAIGGLTAATGILETPSSREMLGWMILVFPVFMFVWSAVATALGGALGFMIGWLAGRAAHLAAPR